MKDNLATYIVDDLFRWMSEERQSLLEPQWRRNYDAWRGRYDSESLNRWKATEGNAWRSKVFVRLTKQKVVAGYNQMMAVASQHGGIPWDIKPSPIPEGMGSPEDMKLRCALMKRQIKDNFSDSKADRAFQSACLENAIYGQTWLRGPVLRTERRAVNIPDYGIQVQEVRIPKLEYPGIWNMFWDLETEDINQGAGIFFREMLGRGRFVALAEQPGYDREAIAEIVNNYQSDEEETGVGHESDEGPIAEQFLGRKRVIPIYRFWGRVPKKYIEDKVDVSDQPKSDVEIFCVCAGKAPAKVIYGPKVAVLPYRPCFRAKWQDLPGESHGLGIPEDMEDSQMIINGLVRSMLDNKALSSNIMMGWNPRYLAPGQNKILYPGKAFEVAEHAESIRQGIEFFYPPDNTGNTMDMIEQFRNFADDETGISRMMEGGAGPKNKTAFEMSQIVESGNKMIGGVIRNIDEGIIEPAITGYYHYHMLVNTDPRLKGDFTPEAKGFQSYIDRARRGQNIMTLMQFAMSNQVTSQFIKFLPALREWASTMDIDPEELIITDEEHQSVIQQQQQMQQLQQAAAMRGGV